MISFCKGPGRRRVAVREVRGQDVRVLGGVLGGGRRFRLLQAEEEGQGEERRKAEDIAVGEAEARRGKSNAIRKMHVCGRQEPLRCRCQPA